MELSGRGAVGAGKCRSREVGVGEGKIGAVDWEVEGGRRRGQSEGGDVRLPRRWEANHTHG